MDTNVLVSAVLNDGSARRLLRLLARTGRLGTSHAILEEFMKVMSRPPLVELFSPRTTANLVSFEERHALIVQPSKVDWKENPKDAVILGTASEAGSVLVTGDRVIHENAKRFGVMTCSIRDALQALEE